MERRRLKPALALMAALAWAAPAGAEGGGFAGAMAAYDAGRAGEAARLFRDLAAGGDPQAQFNLAVLCHTGQGLPRNDREALYWAWRARLSGVARAALLAGRIAPDLPPAEAGALADRLMADLAPELAAGDLRALLGAATIATLLRAPPAPTEAYFWQSLAAALDPRPDRARLLGAARDATLAQIPAADRGAVQETGLARFRDWCAAHPGPAPDACAAAR